MTTHSDEDSWTVLQRFYDAEAAYVAAGGPGHADYGSVAAFLDPDVVLYQAPGMPFSGTGVWQGHDGMERWIAVFSRTWSSLEILEQEHICDGATVVVKNRVRFRGRATGEEVETTILQWVRVENGRLVEIHPFYWDPTAIADAGAAA